MGIKVLKNDNYSYLVEVSGAMDLASSQELRNTFMHIIRNKIEHFIINLEEVSSINSAGIGALIFISSTLKKQECPMVVIAPEEPALQALEITKLKSYFTIVASLQEAQALVKS